MTIPAISPCFLSRQGNGLPYRGRETVAVFFGKGNSDLRSRMPLNRADAPTITGITKTLLSLVATTVSSNARVNRLPAFWAQSMSLSIFAHPSRSSTIPIASGLCRRTKLKNLLVSASSFSLYFAIAFSSPGFSVFIYQCHCHWVYEFSATQSCAEPFPHSVIFPYAKTHSQKHTCIFPIPTWLIRFLSSRNFPGSSNTQTQKQWGLL